MADTKFSHQKASSPDAQYTSGGLRSSFVYRDLDVTPATNGKLRVQLIRAVCKSLQAKRGTGVHFDLPRPLSVRGDANHCRCDIYTRRHSLPQL
jgi:hypothetical protein